MQEILAQVFTYVWSVWRHRWLALAVAWAIAVGGWIWVWQLPEAYVATARVYVDTNSVLRPLLRGLAVQPNIDQRIAMLSRTLLSRPNLEKLMRMTDLDLAVDSEQEKEQMLSRLGDAISLGGDRGNASLYSIAVRDEDRQTARRVAQSLLTVFIESSLGEKRADNTGAQSFLDKQIAEYEQRLIAAENRLAKFKQENVDVLPGGGGDYYSRLQASRSDLHQAELQLSELENRRDEVQRQLDGEEPVFLFEGGVSTVGGITPLDVRIQSLRSTLDSLRTRYTDKHPEVQQIRNLITSLESERTREFSRQREDEGSKASGLSASPVYQGMRTMLAQTEATVAELKVRVAEYQRRATSLEAKVNNIPEIEAQLKQLDRDYAVVSEQHQEMLQRRESARLSEDVEQNASDVVFRVIDPPYVPTKPSDPNKLLLNGGVLLAALAAGIGTGLLASLIAPVIVDPRTLMRVTGLPLLGTVTLCQTGEERRKELVGIATFAALSATLLLVYFGLSLGQGHVLS